VSIRGERREGRFFSTILLIHSS